VYIHLSGGLVGKHPSFASGSLIKTVVHQSYLRLFGRITRVPIPAGTVLLSAGNIRDCIPPAFKRRRSRGGPPIRTWLHYGL